MTAARRPRSEALGPDRIRVHAHVLVVESPVDMPDWEFRTYRRASIQFRGTRYFVQEKLLLPDASYRYILVPWTGELVDLAGVVIEYDEGYVEARDAGAREERRRRRESAALYFVTPLIGFLPSRLKLRLNDRHFFDPRDVTEQSLLLERVLLYVMIAVLAIAAFTGILGRALPWLGGAAVAVALDLVVRTGRLEQRGIDQPGFWEWIMPSWRRRNRRF